VILTAPAAFGFVLYAMYGTGAEVVFWGVCVMLAGVPVYLWFSLRPALPSPEGEGAP